MSSGVEKGCIGNEWVKKLLNKGDISQTEYDAFFDACLCFHKEALLYAVKWFPLNNDLLKEAAFLNILEPKSCFQDVLGLCEKLKKYVKFTSDQMLEMKQEFLLLQKITIDDFEWTRKKLFELMFYGTTYMK